MAPSTSNLRASALTLALLSSPALALVAPSAAPRVAAMQPTSRAGMVRMMASNPGPRSSLPPDKLQDRWVEGQVGIGEEWQGSLASQVARNAEDNLVAATGDKAVDIITGASRSFVKTIEEPMQDYPVEVGLRRIENDLITLDEVVGNSAQLSATEFTILGSTIFIALTSPFLFAEKVVEVMVPSAAAVSAAVGLSAEFVGKSAVANGKEIAAMSLMAAAEAEAGLSQAERVKAIAPLAVGLATSATAFALLAPALVEEIASRVGLVLATEIYLIPPLVAVLSAAVAGLTNQETTALCNRVVGVGNRRFAKSTDVGATWLSAPEQVFSNYKKLAGKWKDFAIATLPAPLLATIVPGPLSFKAIVCAAFATAQAAYYLASAEYEIARAMDAVALKARSAALADTYANQGARSGAILPFTSALGGLCAAATAAAVEVLPLVSAVEAQALLITIFPSLGALFAAAASVSKARCEVDASAAAEAADTISDPTRESQRKVNQGLRPLRGVVNLINLSITGLSRTGRKQWRRLTGKYPILGNLLFWTKNGSGTPATA